MEINKLLKKFIKRKISFSQSLLVTFLITGGISFASDNYIIENIVEGKKYWITYNKLDVDDNLVEKDYYLILIRLY